MPSVDLDFSRSMLVVPARYFGKQCALVGSALQHDIAARTPDRADRTVLPALTPHKCPAGSKICLNGGPEPLIHLILGRGSLL